MTPEKNACTKSLTTYKLNIPVSTLPSLLSLPCPVFLPVPFRSPPPISDIIRPYSRNSQTNQIPLDSLRLQFLRFCITEFPFLEILLACVVCFY